MVQVCCRQITGRIQRPSTRWRGRTEMDPACSVGGRGAGDVLLLSSGAVVGRQFSVVSRIFILIRRWCLDRCWRETAHIPHPRWSINVYFISCERMDLYSIAAGCGYCRNDLLCSTRTWRPWRFASRSMGWWSCLLRAVRRRWSRGTRHAGCAVCGDLGEHAAGISPQAGIGTGRTARGAKCGTGSGEPRRSGSGGFGSWRNRESGLGRRYGRGSGGSGNRHCGQRGWAGAAERRMDDNHGRACGGGNGWRHYSFRYCDGAGGGNGDCHRGIRVWSSCMANNLDSRCGRVPGDGRR